MNKNKFFEKVGKLTFSVTLTGILVTGIVLAATGTWDTYTDGDTISGTEWGKMVTEIQNKVNNIDLPDFSTFYTKTEADNQFTTSAEVIESVMNTCKICIAQGDRDNAANFTNGTNQAYACANFGSIGRLNTIGKVNSDDQLAFKIECGIPGTWSIPTTTAYTGSCGTQRITNNEKSGFCSTSGPDNIYYAGETSCIYVDLIGSKGEPIDRPGFKYSNKKTQTCN